MTLSGTLVDRLAVPVIAAPMTGVSGPDLVIAACLGGVIGSFPTHNAPNVDVLDQWLHRMSASLGIVAGVGKVAPVAPNLVVHRTNTRLGADLDCLIRHGVELVITSVGSPNPVIGPLHDAGCQVFADVSTLQHVDRAIDLGVDGLVLLSAGAGGQTGSANPFAFVRAVRERFDGTVVLAGGIVDGTSVLAAQVLGADLVYMGTRFIATTESLAHDDYRAELVSASLDDVRLSTEVGGLPANILAGWLNREAGNDERLPAAAVGDFQQRRLLREQPVWSAGHSVSAVDAVTTVPELIETIRQQYEESRGALSRS